MKAKTTILIINISFIISGLVTGQEDIIDLKFEQPPVSDSEKERTLHSLVKIQGTGQFCQDGLYLMTQYGDREEIFQKENQKAIDNPLINETWRHCSIFSTKTNNYMSELY